MDGFYNFSTLDGRNLTYASVNEEYGDYCAALVRRGVDYVSREDLIMEIKELICQQKENRTGL